MGKSSPPPPDYKGAAMEQGDASKEVASQTNWANRPTVNTPWGSQTWQTQKAIDPATGKPVTQWTSNVNLSPQQQAALDDQMAIQSGRSDAAQQLLGQATQGFQTPANWDALPERGSLGEQGQLRTSVPTRQAQTSLGSVPFGFGDAPDSAQLQTSLNGNSGDYRQRAQDAVNQLLEPKLQQRRESAQSGLLNQGLSQDSEAYKNAMRDVSDDENRAYLQAIDSGRNEASMAFNQDLQAGQFGNQAEQNMYSMGLSSANFDNARQQQAFQQQLSEGQFYNQGQQQQFGQDSLNANLNNQAQQQQFNQDLQGANFTNQNRQQAIMEMIQKRGMSLNELNALLTGQQVNMPQFPGANTAAASSQNPDLVGAMQKQYGAQWDAANLQNSQTSQAASAGVMLAAMYAMSDERVKEDIRPTGGVLSSGLRVVHYRYRGCPLRHVGVIAQEALRFCPEAVDLHPSGYLMVNYGKVH